PHDQARRVEVGRVTRRRAWEGLASTADQATITKAPARDQRAQPQGLDPNGAGARWASELSLRVVLKRAAADKTTRGVASGDIGGDGGARLACAPAGGEQQLRQRPPRKETADGHVHLDRSDQCHCWGYFHR